MPDTYPLLVVAVGGNALIKDPSHPEVDLQWAACRETCAVIADLVAAGHPLIVTHGNGPQFGFLLRRDELSVPEVHPSPLDLISADTQGSIGYMFSQGLRNEFSKRGIEQPVAALVTQVEVDANDEAFRSPTKPIGGFMKEERETRVFKRQGWQVVEDSGRGFRRVIASPTPKAIVELDVIRTLVDAGVLVIAAGGGGIPVVRTDDGLIGRAAVIDKDLATALLAHQLGVPSLVILTGVSRVATGFATEQPTWHDRMTTAEARGFMAAGEFPKGSMGPKVEAAVRFVEAGGEWALITDTANLAAGLEGRAGTRIVP